MNNLVLIAPEIFLAAVALLIIVGDAFTNHLRKPWLYLSVLSLFLAGFSYVSFFLKQALPGAVRFGLEPIINGNWIQYPPLFNMVAVDSLAIFFKIAIITTVLVIFWMSADYPEFESVPFATYSALLLLATVGMLFLVSATDFLLAAISIELLSVSSFILTGFVFRARRSSSEAAIKYFLVGGLSTALLLLGISYFYGYFGTTNISPLLSFNGDKQAVDGGLSLILVLLISGLGFKLAMVPFHMWAPDAYEGAPTPITAFLSVAPKAAAIGFIIRVFSQHAAFKFTPVLAVLAALTMTVGNVGALPQTNVKRLLAYSSIAQVGYILAAIVAGPKLGIQAAMVYTFIYLFMNLGVFAVLLVVANISRSEELDTFAGLSKRSFGLSLVMILLLLSMTGIPPLAGFVGKFGVFGALIEQKNYLWLVVIAVLNSVVSLYYYFKIAQQMFFKEATQTLPLKFSPALVSCLILALGVTLVVGFLPNQLLGWVRNLVGS